MLDDIEAAVGAGFDDRVADVGHVGDPLPVVQTIAATTLRPALDDVSRDRPGGDLIPGVGSPPKCMHQRPQRQAGVGHASRDHHLRAALQRLDDRSRAKVRVGREHLVADVVKGPARVEILEIVPSGEQAVQTTQEIVTRDDADRQLPVQTERPRDRGHRHGARPGIHSARVCGDPNAPLHNGGKYPLHLRDEIGGVATRGIA